LAPSISEFFNQPQLVMITRVLTLSFIIQAFLGVQNAKLTKELNFKLQTLMQLPASIIGAVVAIILATKGFGVWSLVFLRLITSLIYTLQHWVRTDWRPKLIFDKSKLQYHFNFGYKLTLSGLITTLYTNSYMLLIGKLFPAAQLGYYSQADTLRMFPVRNITAVLQKVTYPVFSSIQDNNQQLKRTFAKITSLVMYIIVPLMLLLILIAEPLFRFVLTEKWLPAVPYFQILCISAIFYPLSIYNLNIILVKGKSGLHLKLELIKKISSLIVLILLIPLGIFGIVYAQLISMLIHAFVNILYSGKLINYSMREQFLDMFPIIGLGIFSMLIIWIVDMNLSQLLIQDDFIHLIVISLVYITVYLSLSKLIKLNAFLDLIVLVRNGFKNKVDNLK
jgi:O-antigen/teichoic acid export membrane protein